MNDYRKITLLLGRDEWELLLQAAKRDYRHPRDQARVILRDALLDTDQEKHNDAVSIRQDTHGAVAAIAG